MTRETGNLEKNRKKTEKKKRKKPDLTTTSNVSNKNREFAVVTYLFLAIFLCLMLYFVYFMVVQSEDFINNPYNTRTDSFAKTIKRGNIVSADGYVLAETSTDEEGNDTRTYPYGNMFAHVVGYSVNGKSGIESMMNFNLLRAHTFFLEKVVNELQGVKTEGDNVYTTLNYTLQATAYDALGNYDGAVVVLEPSTGKILAMVSKPDYDPNNIAADWESLTSEDNNSSVLLNRATQGLYPPGSTFKIFTTLEYIHENANYNEFEFDCDGSISSDGAKIHCYGNKKHGSESLLEAFADSCNSAYASIGLELNAKSFTELCESMLFNSALPTKFVYNQSSFTFHESAGDSDRMETAIGQGTTLVTPFHMALVASAIANDGILMNPYVIDYTENYKGDLVDAFEPSEYGELMTKEDAALMQQFMSEVVTEGTGTKLAGAAYQAAGKTGSAEFSDTSSDSHAWFVGYAHQDGKNDIAIAVIVEDSGSGSEYAVPIAKKVFDAYYVE